MIRRSVGPIPIGWTSILRNDPTLKTAPSVIPKAEVHLPTSEGTPPIPRLGLATALVSIFILLCSMGHKVGITWDEPEYIVQGVDAGRTFQRSLGHLKHLNFGLAFQEARDASSWRVGAMNSGIQRIYNGIVFTLLGDWFNAPWLQRGATAFAWTLMLWVLFLLAREAFGPTAGWAALIIGLGSPRLLGHGLLSCSDVFLAVTWVFALWAYLRSFTGRSPAWFTGLACGLAMMAKFQSFALLGILSLWGFLYDPKKAVRIFLVALPVGLAVFFAFQPLYWKDPFGQLMWLINFYGFKATQYSSEMKMPVHVFFEGKAVLYPPWYYPPVIWAVSTPLPFMALSLWGLWQTVRRFDPYRVLFFWMAFSSMAIPVLAGNIYDGERLFLQAYPALILLASGGVAVLLQGRETLRKPLLAALSGATLLVLVQNFPFYQDYYSGLVGGPVGAHKRGFESSYWLNAITPDMLEAINREVPPNGSLFCKQSEHIFAYYKSEGRIRKDIQVTNRYLEGTTGHILHYRRLGNMDGKEIREFDGIPAIYEVKYRGLSLTKLQKVGASAPASNP